nr:immunoglobulin light chain junction region [Macaca mulatta]
CMQARDFPLTF